VSRLLSCPFCREMFESSEHTRCPECDVMLKPLSELPPSYEVQEEEAVAWEQTAPEDLPLPLFDLGRGRGLLLVTGVASLLVFFLAPWVAVHQPYNESYTGFALARGALGWLWGGAVAWFVTLALVPTRRTIHQMRGVRAVLALFASMTTMEVVLLLVLSPRSSGGVRFDYTWSFGVYAALALSITGVVLALFFGGPVSAKPAEPPKNKHVTLRPVAPTRRTLH
jgi:hypothetical protein